MSFPKYIKAVREMHEYFGPIQLSFTCPKMDYIGPNKFISDGLWIYGTPNYAAAYKNDRTGEAHQSNEPEAKILNG